MIILGQRWITLDQRPQLEVLWMRPAEGWAAFELCLGTYDQPKGEGAAHLINRSRMICCGPFHTIGYSVVQCLQTWAVDGQQIQSLNDFLAKSLAFLEESRKLLLQQHGNRA